MKPASPFLDLSNGACVNVTFDGATLSLPEGANLAAALLAADVTVFRNTAISAAPRAPFCMMGACFDCLVQIDGTTRQACMIEVSEGLDLSRPNGPGATDA